MFGLFNSLLYICRMKYIKEELEDLIINQKLSYLEIGRRYEVSGTTIIKHAKKLGITLEQRSK